MIKIVIEWLLWSMCFFKVVGVMAEEETNQVATFAGGCFWCMQHDFDEVPGVVSTSAGYTGGSKANPTYKEVSSGATGHVEAVEVTYDPDKVTYEQLLEVYFHNIDPTRNDGQFCDKGEQYRPVIFYHNKMQQELAESYKQELIVSKKVQPVLVDIVPVQTFYPAEEYHQKYYLKNPMRYKFYRYNCGRDKRLEKVWGKPVNR